MSEMVVTVRMVGARARLLDEIEAAVHGGSRMAAAFEPDIDAAIDNLLRKHAHELAQQIRNHDWHRPVICCGDAPDEPEDAADLIDPERA